MSIQLKGTLIYFAIAIYWFALAEVTIPDNVGGMRLIGSVFLFIAAWQLVFGFSKKAYEQAKQQSEATSLELTEAARIFRSSVLACFYPRIALVTILPWIGILIIAPRPSGFSEWTLACVVILTCALSTYFLVAFLWANSREKATQAGTITPKAHFAICILIVIAGIIIKAVSPAWLEFARNFF